MEIWFSVFIDIFSLLNYTVKGKTLFNIMFFNYTPKMGYYKFYLNLSIKITRKDSNQKLLVHK